MSDSTTSRPRLADVPYRSAEEREAWDRKLQSVAQRLEQVYSSIPWYARAAQQDPTFWVRLAASMPNR